MKILKQIFDKIKENKRIVIYGHKRPDGDCYGSQFGLKDIIKTTFPEKEVYVVGAVSDYVKFLGDIDEIDDELCSDALAIVVDTATIERCSDSRFRIGKEIIKIDHHISDELYGDINWVMENAPACSQMIAMFFLSFQKELKITEKGAKALYTGIVTDSGGFRYRGIDKKTFEVAGQLLELGADNVLINEELSKTSLAILKLKAYFLDNIETSKHFIYVRLPKDVYERLNVSSEDAAALVNNLANVENYKVWAIIIEYPNKEYRVRLRSSGVDIEKIARKYKGGGHSEACGATLDNFSQVLELAKDIDQYIESIV